MRVSDKHKFAYIHIPKTGGVAIVKYILWPLGFERINERPRHQGYIPNVVPDDYHIFAFIRNPYRRAVSLYRHRFIRSTRFKRKNPDISTFINWLQRDHEKNNKLLTQSQFLHPRVTTYRFEDFDSEVQRLCDTLKIKVPDMPKAADTNYYGEYDWKKWVNEDDIRCINKIFEDDFKLGYEKWMP